MHLITNDYQKAKIAAGDHVEKQKQDLLKYIEREKEHIVYIEDQLVNPADSIKQMGHPLTHVQMEKILATLVPSSVAFINNPIKPNFKAVVRVLGRKFDSPYETISPYEKGIIPEHSILQLKTIEIPDPDVIARRKKISRNDLPKYEFDPRQGFVFEEGVTRPGFIKVKQLGREITRGWRTILIRLLTARLISLADVERVFGNPNTAAWHQNVYGVQHNIPW